MLSTRTAVGALAALAALALTLAGCGSDDASSEQGAAATTSATSERSASSTAASPTTTQFPSEQLPRAEVERVFVANMEESGFIPRYGTAADVVQLADLVCVHFNQGRTMAELMATVMPGATMSEAEFRSFAAAAAVGFCPEHVKDVLGS